MPALPSKGKSRDLSVAALIPVSADGVVKRLEAMHQVEGRERGEAEVGGVHCKGRLRQALTPGAAEFIDEDAEGTAQLLVDTCWVTTF